MDTQTNFTWLPTEKRKVNLSRVDELGIKYLEKEKMFQAYIVINGKYLPLVKFDVERDAFEFINDITK
jgi:hypothetical protein